MQQIKRNYKLNESNNLDLCRTVVTESVASSMPVQILPAADIKAYVKNIPPVDASDKRPPKFFRLGYIRELTSDISTKYQGGRGSAGMPTIRIFKCIEYSKLYTGFPFYNTNDTRKADKEIGTSRHTGEKTGFSFGDSDFTNKIGTYKSGAEALQAYIANDSKQKVRFYISVDDGDLTEADKVEVAKYLSNSAAAKLLAPATRQAVGTSASGENVYDKQVNRFKLSGIYQIGDLGTSLIEAFDHKKIVENYIKKYIYKTNLTESNKTKKSC